MELQTKYFVSHHGTGQKNEHSKARKCIYFQAVVTKKSHFFNINKWNFFSSSSAIDHGEKRNSQKSHSKQLLFSAPSTSFAVKGFFSKKSCILHREEEKKHVQTSSRAMPTSTSFYPSLVSGTSSGHETSQHSSTILHHQQNPQPTVPHLPNHLFPLKTSASISWVELSVMRREQEQKYQLKAAREQDDVFHLIWHANYQITSRYKGSVYI